MTTRRQLIQSISAIPLITAAGATALLAACGKKETAEVAAPTPAPAPAAEPAPAAAPVAEAPAAPAATVATGPLVDEKDAAAIGLGYVAVATKADKTKYPKYADGQQCGNCALYQGGAAEQGGCPLFAGKQVVSKAWCSAYNKKAA